jgi:nitroimidazol reductase NimA-like FMN-containing flavoprotein (pyridoxamine 5'-phosphate oxidase superfamily)
MDEIKDLIINYLSKRKFLTLATSSQKGEPLTHPIAYVNKEDTIYFSTSSKTRKYKNIQKNPNVAYSVYEQTEHLEDVISVQMEGKATPVTDKKEIIEINEMLKQKFPSMAKLTTDPDNVIVKISPKLCYFSDYTKRFGYRDRIEY